MGVDHTSGTDTKVETTDKPQAPPDRPGAPGQPSRLESRAAVQAPAETGTGGEKRDDDPTDERTEADSEERDTPRPGEPSTEKTDEPDPATRQSSERYPDPNDDPNTVGRPRAESWVRARETQSSGSERPQDSERRDLRENDDPTESSDTRPETEPGRPDTEPSETPRGPRAESWARATQTQQGTDTGRPQDSAPRDELVNDGQADNQRAEVDETRTQDNDNLAEPSDTRADDGMEPDRPDTDSSEVSRGPRAESWARAIEAQKAALEARQTPETEDQQDRPDTPGQDAEPVEAQPVDREPATDEQARGKDVPAHGAPSEGTEPTSDTTEAEKPDAEPVAARPADQGTATEGAEPLRTDRASEPEDGTEPTPGTTEAENPDTEPVNTQPADRQPATGDQSSGRDVPEPGTAAEGTEPLHTDRATVPEDGAEPTSGPAETDRPDVEPVAAQVGDREPADDQTGGRGVPDQEPRADDGPATEGAEPLRTHREPGAADAERSEEPAGRTGEPTTPDREDTPDPIGDTEQQPAARDDPQPLLDGGRERPDETVDESGNDDTDRGRNAGDQPESPASREPETDQFAGLPTRADLDPASAGELTAERGEPLAPVDEEQDLSEPEDADRISRILRRSRDNPDDAEKNLDNLISNIDQALKKPPSGNPISSQDTSNRGDPIEGPHQPDSMQGASAFVGAAVLAMMAMKVHEKVAGRIRAQRGSE